MKDFGIADIELSLEGDDVVRRIKKKMLEKLDEVQDPQQIAVDAKKEMAIEAKLREHNERRRRQRIQVKGHVDIEISDDLRVKGGMPGDKGMPDDPASEKQRNLLVALGEKAEYVSRIGRRQASGMIGRHMKKGKRPDWSLLREIPIIRSNLEAVPPSEWQRERLQRLGFYGVQPKNYAAASGLIRQLESQRMGQ